MLISSQFEPLSLPLMSYIDNHSDRSSHQTNTSSLIPPTLLPKYFNVPFAIQHGYFRCIRYLLELCYDPNERDNQLRTPLILCSYVENNRWSLSLAQNLLEKGAKIALEDHARRNAMHHACALQRIHLVQLYLSCLDFNIESKDCEGNTCLHYVAITGNCEIAELLIKSAEKLGVHLDQYVNREGCSAAVIALKYGHIECANQITHRDWDEFFVVPRPLSIYETYPTTDVNHSPYAITPTTPIKKKKIKSNPPKNDIRPSTLSFGLLKIIFNEGDSSYSTRLAGLCDERKENQHHRRLRHKKQEGPKSINKFDQTNSNILHTAHYCSTEALVNEYRSSTIDDEHKLNYVDSEDISSNIRASPRMQLLMQQHLSNDQIKSKLNRQASSSTINNIETNVSRLYESSQAKNQLQRPKTAIISRNQTSVNAVGIPSRLSSPKIQPTSTYKKSQKKSTLINRPKSAPFIPKQQHSSLTSETTTTYSQTLFDGRPVSAVLQNQCRHPPAQRTIDSSCTIREAKGATSRYNKPEELFGIKPEELFGSTDHQPKMLNPRKTNDNIRSKHHNLQNQQYIWQQDVDKLVDLYNIHHSSNYRKTAIPPPRINIQSTTTSDLSHIGKAQRMSGSKHPLNNSQTRSPTNPKLSTLASLNILRRNSVNRHPSIKLTNA